MSEERWLPVVGYEGLYEVSDQGRVRSLDRIDALGRMRPGRLLSPAQVYSGHMIVRLCKEGKSLDRGVHVLVLEAFFGPRPIGMECCHWNDIPSDNRLENLRWGTHSENARDSVRNGTHNQARKVYCKNGHLFNEQNTYIRPDGSRMCRTCHAANQRARREQNREACRRYRARKRAERKAA